MKKNKRHILGISGGKDSAALAIWMKKNKPEIDLEYIFCDTGKELKEVYDYINLLEAYLGKPIKRLPKELDGSRNDFDHILKLYNGYLPSAMSRWCTKDMKLEPFERYIAGDNIINYVGIRYDERDRKGYMTHSDNVETVFPFIKHKIDYSGVLKILEDEGVGIPKYYKWRSRSGCFFCFYQRPSEWIGLAEKHPDLYIDSMKYEKINVIDEFGKKHTKQYTEVYEVKLLDEKKDKKLIKKNDGLRILVSDKPNLLLNGWSIDKSDIGFSWTQNEFLADKIKKTRLIEIKENAKINLERAKKRSKGSTLIERLDEARDLEDHKTPCTICHI